MNELALFAGAGGGILGGHLLGWRTVCAVEWEPYAACVLAARQNDGLLPPFPIWDDIQTFDGRPWAGIVDVVSGGFPCQDISVAGKGDGLDGERSGMWRHMARVVGEIRPRFVFVENSPMLTSRGGTRVLADLAALGYDARWTVMGAADVGAPHQRDRFWLVAHSTSSGRYERGIQNTRRNKCTFESWSSIEFGQSSSPSSSMAHANSMRELQPQGSQQDQRGWIGNSGDEVAYATSQRQQAQSNGEQHSQTYCHWQTSQSESGSEVLAESESKRLERWMHCRNYESAIARPWQSSGSITTNWLVEPNVGRVAHGVAARVDRLKAIGNGQVPLCAATAFRELAADWMNK